MRPWAQTSNSRRLVFGRFLNFMPTGINLEIDLFTLSERRFRDAWLQHAENKKGPEKSGPFCASSHIRIYSAVSRFGFRWGHVSCKSMIVFIYFLLR